MRLFLALLASALLLSADANFEQALTIDPTKCGTGDSTDFPTLVHLSANNFKLRANGGLVENASGYDIRFWSDPGRTTALAWSIDYYDGVNGVVWAWAKNGTVSHSAPGTVFYVSIGDPTISTFQSTAAAVWSNGYVLVWHGGGASLSLADSSSNAFAIANSATPVTTTSGKIAGGAAFAAASSEFLAVDTDPAALQPAVLSVSTWVNYTSTTGTRYVLAKTGNGYRIFGLNGGTSLVGSVRDSAGTDTQINFGNNLNNGAWRQLVMTFDATASGTGALKAYLNASPITPVNAVNTGGIKYTAGSMQIGAVGGATFWDGALDEIEIRNLVSPPEWVTTAFNNQNAPDSFLTPGALFAATPPAGSASLLGVGR